MYGISTTPNRDRQSAIHKRDVEKKDRTCHRYCSWCKEMREFKMVEDKYFERSKWKCKGCYEFGRQCIYCPVAMCREYGINGEVDKSCLKCLGVVKNWKTAKEETMETYEGWCSWCFSRTKHELVQRNRIRRNVYKCLGCKERSLKCTDCLYLLNNTGYKPVVESGVRKDTTERSPSVLKEGVKSDNTEKKSDNPTTPEITELLQGSERIVITSTDAEPEKHISTNGEPEKHVSTNDTTGNVKSDHVTPAMEEQSTNTTDTQSSADEGVELNPEATAGGVDAEVREILTTEPQKTTGATEGLVAKQGVHTEQKKSLEGRGPVYDEKIKENMSTFAFARGGDQGDDKWCARHQGRITDWEDPENINMLKEFRYCSWCVSQQKHSMSATRFIGRNAFDCEGCKMPTLICYSCTDGMAMGGTYWDDRTCVICQGDYVKYLNKGLQPFNDVSPINMSETMISMGLTNDYSGTPAPGQPKSLEKEKDMESSISHSRTENNLSSTSRNQTRGLTDYVGDVGSFLSVWNSRVSRKARTFENDTVLGIFASGIAGATGSLSGESTPTSTGSGSKPRGNTSSGNSMKETKIDIIAEKPALGADPGAPDNVELNDEDGHMTKAVSMGAVADMVVSEQKSSANAKITTGFKDNPESWMLLEQHKKVVYAVSNDREAIDARLREDTPEKNLALAHGFIRPYLYLLSMTHEQRNRVANILGWSLIGSMIFGNPHKETWRIISGKDGFYGFAQDGSERSNRVQAKNIDWCHVLDQVCAKMFPAEVIPEVPPVPVTKEVSRVSHPHSNWDELMEDAFLQLLAEHTKAQMTDEQKLAMQKEKATAEGQELLKKIEENSNASNKDVLEYGVHMLYGLNSVSQAADTRGVLNNVGKGAALFGGAALATTLGVVGIGIVAWKVGEAAYKSSYQRLFGPCILILQHRLVVGGQGIDIKDYF